MKPEQLYQELKDLAQKIGITVSEQNFRKTGVPVKSGLCVVKGESRYIMDKHRAIRTRIDLLAECLSEFPLENIYIVPAVREHLEMAKKGRELEGLESQRVSESKSQRV
jgi:hypothetical protein